ncbi:MAG: DUF4349 domain-containing protein [Deltaproteobacteria bacterium]|nr:DUF4349 domain-containing protein [Deltaproteobacteria bacterium]
MSDTKAPPPPPAASKPMPMRSKKIGRISSGKGGSKGKDFSRGGPGAANQREESESIEGQEQPPAKINRMVHYNGFVKLRVTSPKETLASAAKLSETVGGYIESLTDNAITLRVPVAKFREIYAAVLKLGDVLDRSMTAEDVTDSYTYISLRLKTLKASRDRLIDLLARARKEHEKLQILAEIRRLTEEIDRAEMQVKTLASLAEFSRLSIEAIARQPRESSSSVDELAAFRWIRSLSPFSRDIAHQGKRLKLNVPEGMVLLSEKTHWTAESADGAVIWASTRENIPVGTTDYWMKAVQSRLAPEYKSASITNIGDFAVLRLVDQSEAAYRYLIGLRVIDDELQIVEIYYPSQKHEQRYHDAVNNILERGES